MNVSDEELAERRKKWQAPTPTVTSGVLAKYARLVSSASLGCVTDMPPEGTDLPADVSA